ncbi:hypothetical protein LUZ61_000373 [Rhynchospora tenuis]|uniref:Uncharacterized protein n=1 Tax=Rhynchospora tenuis TaxID=198213 RepID=A0AAD5ZF87_9POAL|nr:hypothetical protein LUZ61_000373 [Rhynchospora tenuis]
MAVYRSGVTLLLTESKNEIQQCFEENHGVTAEAELREPLDQAMEASHLIQHMIVQANRSTSGSFGNSTTIPFCVCGVVKCDK